MEKEREKNLSTRSHLPSLLTGRFGQYEAGVCSVQAYTRAQDVAAGPGRWPERLLLPSEW